MTGSVEEKAEFDAQLKASGNFLTRSKAFKKLTQWAFKVCDANNTTHINKAELYAGLMLVHLNLAKYAGPAACYPAPRAKVEALFDACDDDDSGTIDETEFEQIMVILCSQILSRIAVYYSIIILLVPYLTQGILGLLYWAGLDDFILKMDAHFDKAAPGLLRALQDIVPDSLWETIPNQIISLSLFFFVIPRMFDKIDEVGYQRAKEVYATGGTPGGDADKEE